MLEALKASTAPKEQTVSLNWLNKRNALIVGMRDHCLISVRIVVLAICRF
jgi:hypothetical protein